jgi:hypothetical protein
LKERSLRTIFRSTLPIGALLAAAAALVGMHASAQNAPGANPPRAEKPATPPPAPPVRRPSDDSDSAQAIEDDPTVETGGEQESADANLSFPVDI